MPRLSLWRENHGNDYKFIDRRISEMFTIGGTGVLVHKYLGTENNTTGTDATRPDYITQSELNIQDLLFLENRDRKYDADVYSMRGIYQVQDQDFDLRQFGIFLAQGTTFMTFHLNDMIHLLGRKLMSGDVLELMHLRDFHSLDPNVPFALQRFYSVVEATRAAEGFSPTWYPHLWRVKLQPLVDSQEYKDILNKISADRDPFSANSANTASSIGSILSSYQRYLDINEAVVEQAEVEVPSSGYDTSKFYTVPVENNKHRDPMGYRVNSNGVVDTSSVSTTADSGQATPNAKIQGYLTGDGLGPNGLDVGMGTAFPGEPKSGDSFLRLDYVPNRLFRYSDNRWVKIEDKVRTNLTPGANNNETQRSIFVNNTGTFTDLQGNTRPQRQGLSKALRPEADN